MPGKFNLPSVLGCASFGPLASYLEYEKICQENLRHALGIWSPGQKGPVHFCSVQEHLGKSKAIFQTLWLYQSSWASAFPRGLQRGKEEIWLTIRTQILPKQSKGFTEKKMMDATVSRAAVLGWVGGQVTVSSCHDGAKQYSITVMSSGHSRCGVTEESSPTLLRTCFSSFW